MKYISILTLLLITVIGNHCFAQSDSSLLYLRFPTVPPFSIIKVPDSTRFTKNELQKKQATMIMVFSPDCDHCQQETKELIANIDLFKKVQIIMASPLDFSYLKKFYFEYELDRYPNFIIGRDPGYFLGTFYKVHSFPSIFLYDKKGRFVSAFDGTVPVKKIAEALE